MKSIVGRGDIAFITDTIDQLVVNSGYPVTAQVMKSIGIAREQLRYMERKGFLKSMDLSYRGQLIKGYYTEKAWPSKIPLQEPELVEA